MAIPLDPGAGGRSIPVSTLQKADLIVSTTDAAISVGIRLATLSSVSHARIYVGNGRCVDATGHGVRVRALEAAIRDDGDTLCVAYRKPGLSSTQAQAACDFALAQVGKPYDYAGVGAQAPGVRGSLIGIIAQIAGQGEDRFFCSELVFAAYAHAGAPLDSVSAGNSSPSMVPGLWRRSRLTYVGHLLA